MLKSQLNEYLPLRNSVYTLLICKNNICFERNPMPPQIMCFIAVKGYFKITNWLQNIYYQSIVLLQYPLLWYNTCAKQLKLNYGLLWLCSGTHSTWLNSRKDGVLILKKVILLPKSNHTWLQKPQCQVSKCSILHAQHPPQPPPYNFHVVQQYRSSFNGEGNSPNTGSEATV